MPKQKFTQANLQAAYNTQATEKIKLLKQSGVTNSFGRGNTVKSMYNKAIARADAEGYNQGAVIDILTEAKASYEFTRDIMKGGIENSQEYKEVREQLLEQMSNGELTYQQVEDISQNYKSDIKLENEKSKATIKYFLEGEIEGLKKLSEMSWNDLVEAFGSLEAQEIMRRMASGEEYEY